MDAEIVKKKLGTAGNLVTVATLLSVLIWVPVILGVAFAVSGLIGHNSSTAREILSAIGALCALIWPPASIVLSICISKIKAERHQVSASFNIALVSAVVCIICTGFLGLGFSYLIFPLLLLGLTFIYVKILRILLYINNPDKKETTADTLSNGDGLTTLIEAVYKNNVPQVKELVEKSQANVNMINPQTGVNALWVAAAGGNSEIVKLLLAADGDIDNTNKEGKSVLDIARERGHKDIVQLLEAHGAK